MRSFPFTAGQVFWDLGARVSMHEGGLERVKMGKKSKMSGNGSPWHRFELCGHGEASHGPSGAIGTIPGPQNGPKKMGAPMGALAPLLGAALKGMLHWYCLALLL